MDMDDILAMDNSIILRKMKQEDLDFLVEAQTNPENSQFVSQWSKNKLLTSFNDSNFLFILIQAVNDLRPLGYIILSDIEKSNKCVYLKQIVITEKRKGFGRASLKLIKALAFDNLRAHKLHLWVWTHNTNAINLYKSEDFFEEGVIRDSDRINNRYLSYTSMSMLENEFYDQDRR